VQLIKVTYFFRKPTASFHSIEMLFATVVKHLSISEATKVTLPYNIADSTTAVLKNCDFARKRQGQVNHITGEIYYIALALKKSKTILTIHDVDSLRSNNKAKSMLLHLFWLYLPVRCVRYVTVVSEYSKHKLLEATGIAKEKIFVVPNSVPFTVEDYKPKKYLNKQEPVLLQVGTKPNKNLPNLIEAIRKYPCKLIIMGQLSEEHVQMLLVADISYENFVNLSYAEVKALYYKADIITFVSTFEGFGMPILEANALGRPVITSTTTSMPEVAGEGAMLVDPFKPAEIRAAIEQLVADDTLRNELVAVGYKNAQRFRPEVVTALYEELYVKVLERGR
jgi:glycosyltransferase involved in cell wall biosynthesis